MGNEGAIAKGYSGSVRGGSGIGNGRSGSPIKMVLSWLHWDFAEILGNDN